tara:strand:+ start:3347 stop:3988 length:642 start_codon:yes stop_codon:yes gene_type:complete
MNRTLALAVVAAATTAASADPVLVEINGVVWGNNINPGPLGDVNPGETGTISFTVDTTNFINGSFPTRGYAIDLASFSLDFSGGTSIGISPGFAGPAYFVVRNNDPAADGFFLSQGPDFPSDIPLAQAGVFGDFGARFNVSYTGDTLDSLDIADAAGTYDFTGLTVFGMGVNDGPFEDVLGMDFSSMTITVIPAPSALAMLGLGGLVAGRRRR